MIEGHEAYPVTDAVVSSFIQFGGSSDVLELAHHQHHPQHAQTAGKDAL